MARDFESGSSQYLEINSAPLTAAPFTYSAWINPESFAASGNRIVFFWLGDKDNATSAWEFSLFNDGGTNKYRFRAEQGGSGTQIMPATPNPSTATWFHVAHIERSSTDRQAYVDGTSIGTDTTSMVPAGSDRITIGRDGDSTPDGYFDGLIAEVGLWDVGLNTAEISALAKGYSPLLIRPSSLVFYLPLIRDDDNDLIGGLEVPAVNTPGIAAHPRIIYPSFAQIRRFTTAAAAVAAQGAWKSLLGVGL